MARAYRVPLQVMRVVAFAIGSIVIALTAYTAIADRRREYGIVKAMGARASQLVTLAVEQTLLIAAAGFVAGGLLFMVGRSVIGGARPQFQILATTGSLGRAAAAALLMGLAAAIVPARRLARLEPAAAYRSG
jgi:putative ABC transport system permease protein